MRSLIVGAALLAVGLLLVAVGAYPLDDALALAARVWPVLLFVTAITVVAELCAEAGLFAVIASWAARGARGRTVVLWMLVVALATVSTIFLSLDTTAVLLTPIVVTMARHVRVNPLPFALTTVMLANTASLLLPVSNLTNLLADQKLAEQGAPHFVALSWAPALVCVLVPVAALAVIGRRTLFTRYDVVHDVPEVDPLLAVPSAVIVVALLPALVSGVPVWIPATIAAAALLVVFVARRRRALSVGLVPWPTLVLAAGLFLVMSALGDLGLTALLRGVMPAGSDAGALLAVAGSGLVGANAVNNLPAYLALEPVAAHPAQLMALLVGVNAGSLITPWASLATLLWHSRLERLGVHVAWGRYAVIGLVVAPVTVVAATLALSLTT